IVAAIAGVTATSFMTAICALSNFSYLAQAPVVSTEILHTLKEFHNNKQAIIDLGASHGKKHAIKHWHISKLKLM
ncbi:hypothetical protein BS17DRAFT_698468, partial [Gyrodon lividus]